MIETLVVVPYTRRPAWPWTASAPLAAHVRYVDVSGSNDAYWELLASLWEDRRDFILVEHDVVPDAAALADLDGCDRRWCAQPYPYLYGRMNWGLACTRFTAAAMEAVPDLWAQVAAMSDHLHPPRHWCRLDSWSHRILSTSGLYRHDHGLAVKHTHTCTSHGCDRPDGAA